MSQIALIVDDSRLARITLQRLLEKQNFQVMSAGSAREAFDLLREQALPDIIFMDHLMPEMDGFEAMQRIKADPELQHIPVVMCTGKEGNDDYDAQAKARGATATLSKPPELDQLTAVLEETRAAAPAATTQAPAAEIEPLDVVTQEFVAPQEFIATPELLQEDDEEEIPLITETVELEPVNLEAAISLESEEPIPTLTPEVDFTALEERLQASLQQAITGLQQEFSGFQQELSERQGQLSETLRSQQDHWDQQLAALQANQLSAEQIQRLIQESLPEQPAAVTPEALAELQDQWQAQLKTLRQQLLSELDSLRNEAGQQPALPDSFEEQLANHQQALLQEVENIRERATLAREALEQRFSELERAVADQHLQIADQQTALAEQRSALEALAEQPAPVAPVVGLADESVQALEQQLGALGQRVAQLQQDFEADLEQRAIPTLGNDPENLRLQMESDLAALKEQLGQEINGLRAALEQQSPQADLSQQEARLIEAATAAAEQQAKTLATSEVEQLGATLQEQIASLKTALQRLESSEPLHPEFAGQPDPDQIEQLVHERISAELDMASDQLVQRITETLRQQVTEAQQELLDRQDMFEQERAGFKRQIRSLKQNLALMGAGSGLIALAALGAALLM